MGSRLRSDDSGMICKGQRDTVTSLLMNVERCARGGNATYVG